MRGRGDEGHGPLNVAWTFLLIVLDRQRGSSRCGDCLMRRRRSSRSRGNRAVSEITSVGHGPHESVRAPSGAA
jgi:hypothetical protein